MPSAPRSRFGTLSTILLGATLVLAAVLGVLAARSSLAQRRSVDSSLQNYADIAAWQYARAGRAALQQALQASQGMLVREFLRPTPAGSRALFSFFAPTTLPDADLVRRRLHEDPCECITSNGARTAFRIMPDSSFSVDGDSLGGEERRLLVAAAYGDSAVWGRRNNRILPRDSGFVVLFRLRLPTANALRLPEGAAEPITAVYGMIVGPAPIQKLLRNAMNDAQVLAPSLLERMRGTSFVRIRVGPPQGRAVFASAPESASAFVASDTIGQVYGDLRVTATLDAHAAATALLDDRPGPAGLTIVALMILTLALGAGAFVLLRREQQLVRLRSDFVSGVSHELRTPITQIRLHSELLLQDGFKSDQEKHRALSVVHRESLRMSTLIENVLQFGRPKTEKTGSREPYHSCNLSEVSGEVAETFAPLAAEVGARIVVQAGKPVTAAADRDAVTQVLCNLLENALKYGPRGQQVIVTADDGPPGFARLTVADEGPGIPAAERGRVWEPYYRLERDRNAPRGGSGLGLSVVADLVSSVGGHCEVEATPQGGARFVIDLPAARA